MTAARCRCPCSIACRNPLLAAVGQSWPPPRSSWGKARDQVTAARLKDADKIGVPAGKVIDRYKVAKHFILDISPGCLAWRRDLAAIGAEAALDGIYIIRTPVPASELDTAAAVTAHNLAPCRTRLPDHQDRRPGSAPHPPLAAGPGPRPRPDLHARRLPGCHECENAARSETEAVVTLSNISSILARAPADASTRPGLIRDGRESRQADPRA